MNWMLWEARGWHLHRTWRPPLGPVQTGHRQLRAAPRLCSAQRLVPLLTKAAGRSLMGQCCVPHTSVSPAHHSQFIDASYQHFFSHFHFYLYYMVLGLRGALHHLFGSLILLRSFHSSTQTDLASFAAPLHWKLKFVDKTGTPTLQVNSQLHQTSLQCLRKLTNLCKFWLFLSETCSDSLTCWKLVLSVSVVWYSANFLFCFVFCFFHTQNLSVNTFRI